eukprot:gnl/Spiro4/23602_TR11668_c0_g1_i1.p1 gnl/Spiro4/23602_TR11668_c0_g1~~gnl/Spiro4/23602_TR11668_c0_g1_i1.p1  ORF type:complete len:238 (+),score=11.92 gnl/Spiro4/23602_TR11668_c0_g1_i1:22-735(+)
MSLGSRETIWSVRARTEAKKSGGILLGLLDALVPTSNQVLRLVLLLKPLVSFKVLKDGSELAGVGSLAVILVTPLGFLRGNVIRKQQHELLVRQLRVRLESRRISGVSLLVTRITRGLSGLTIARFTRLTITRTSRLALTDTFSLPAAAAAARTATRRPAILFTSTFRRWTSLLPSVPITISSPMDRTARATARRARGVPAFTAASPARAPAPPTSTVSSTVKPAPRSRRASKKTHK